LTVGQELTERVKVPTVPPALASLCMKRTSAPSFARTALKCWPLLRVIVALQSLLTL